MTYLTQAFTASEHMSTNVKVCVFVLVCAPRCAQAHVSDGHVHLSSTDMADKASTDMLLRVCSL